MPEKVLGVLGGRDLPEEKIGEWAARADRIYAADRGAIPLLERGFRPTITGDMDSLNLAGDHTLRVIPNRDQNFSDCDKLLMLAHEDGVTDITLTAIEGDRLDHILGTLSSCLASPLSIRLALRRGLSWMIRPGEKRSFGTRPGQRLSLLPILPSQGVNIQGVEWPLKNHDMAMGGFISLSNRAAEDEIKISLTDGALLLILEFKPEELPIW